MVRTISCTMNTLSATVPSTSSAPVQHPQHPELTATLTDPNTPFVFRPSSTISPTKSRSVTASLPTYLPIYHPTYLSTYSGEGGGGGGGGGGGAVRTNYLPTHLPNHTHTQQILVIAHPHKSIQPTQVEATPCGYFGSNALVSHT
jgi:hypothetical protein